jgi:hypothetical protein
MKLFIAYAAESRRIADETHLALVGAGHDVFFDRPSLSPGENYSRTIRKAIFGAEGLIFLISPGSIEPGSYTLTELKYARSRWPHPERRVLPVMVQPTPLEEIPAYLKAVTILEPEGHIAAEVVDALESWTNENPAASERRVRVTVHRAFFVGRPSSPAYFVNVTNLSRDREVEVTHVWFDTQPRVHVLRPERPLPKRLRPDESWETWIECGNLPDAVNEYPYQLARVRLSTGEVFSSVENVGVPEEGEVPGGPIV